MKQQINRLLISINGSKKLIIFLKRTGKFFKSLVKILIIIEEEGGGGDFSKSRKSVWWL
jgi:hypothetical protein